MDNCLRQAWEVRRGFPPRLGVDRPRATVAVSVTGAACELGCAHCRGHYLRNMAPRQAVPVAGARSYLVSGGCDRWGRVPLREHLDLLDRLRATGARLNLHTGLAGEEDARVLAEYGTVVSLDWVTHAPTLREVYGLEVSPEAYRDTYRALQAYLPVVPHVCVGLRGGRVEGEWEAIERLQELDPVAVVFLVFIPTPGTPYASCPVPAPEEVATVLAYARVRLPRAEISLGCMRPRGRYRRLLDPLAVAAGVNRLVLPAPEAIAEARVRGLALQESEECCALSLVREREGSACG